MSSRTWTLILLLCGVATIVIVVGSPLACQIGEVEPYEVRLAKPYIEKIVPDDTQLRELADAIVQDCPDKEGKVNAVYRYIVEDFTYIPDPENGESINSPFETLDAKGGDCEDLTILACSLLENIGIRTYLVLTESHAYGLVSGIDPDSLWTYINGSLQEQFVEDHDMVSAMDEVLELGARHVYYYGGEATILGLAALRIGYIDNERLAEHLTYGFGLGGPLLHVRFDFASLPGVERVEQYSVSGFHHF